MGQHMQRRVGLRLHRHRGRALAAQERRRVALARVRQQAVDDVEQRGHARAGARGNEAHRDQVAVAQGLLQRRMQFGGIHVAVVQVALDEGAVHFHHLFHQGAVGGLHRAQVTGAAAVEEGVDHLHRAAVGHGAGQVQRQALAAEGGLDLRQHGGQVGARGVDAVDDHHPVEPALGGVLHHAQRHRLDPGGGVEHHHRGVHRLQRRQAVADEIRRARRVDDVDAAALPVAVQHRRLQ